MLRVGLLSARDRQGCAEFLSEVWDNSKAGIVCGDGVVSGLGRSGAQGPVKSVEEGGVPDGSTADGSVEGMDRP